MDTSAGWTWWPPTSEVYNLNLELDVSAHVDSLHTFLSPALPFVLTNLNFFPSQPTFPSPSSPHGTPTLFLSPTPPVYLFFHQIELAESKGIPTIPSQSWVRERDIEDERKWNEVQMQVS